MAQESDLIRRDIERTRVRMDDRADALAYKANVPARTRGWLGSKKDAVVGAGGTAVSRVSIVTDSMVYRVSGATPGASDVQAGAGRMKDTAEQNPLGLAIAGAAVGFIAGIFAPSTRLENERIGPIADDVKSTALEAGQEAFERGKQVAQETASAAVETAKEQGREQGDELTSSLQDKAGSRRSSP